MLIACEKCATTYVLDERLIPAAGAPVQCTRCNHVFTARPGGGSVAAPVPTADTPAPRSTMMFGKAGEKPVNTTMMFGAAGAGGPKADQPVPARNTTMMFGADAVKPPAAPVPAARNTMMFGAEKPPVTAVPKNSTMMFGGSPPAAAAAAPTNQTMMFGAVDVAPPVPARGPTPTMAFGTAAVPPAAAAASPTNRTMMFGVNDVKLAEPAKAPNSTMMFGAPEAAANPGKLTERTVRIGPDDLERMMREHNAKGERGGEMTPPEGQPPAPGASQRTQMFAMSDVRGPESTPSEGTDSVRPRHDRTAMFAMTPESPQLPPLVSAEEIAAPPEKSNVKFDPSLMETLPPGDDSPIRSTMLFGAKQGSRPQLLDPGSDLVGPTLPNLPALPRDKALGLDQPDAVELPAEEPGIAAPADDVAVSLEAQVKRRNRLALIIVALAVLGAAGAVGWKLFGAKLMGKAVPLEAMQGVETGLAELRKDDTASKASAVKTLQAVVKSQPTFVDAHAGLVTALTLQLDDLQQRAKRLDKAAEERNTRIGRYGKEKSPSDWENRASVLVAEVGALKKEYDPLVASARELEGRLREAYRAMQAAASQAGELNRQAELSLIRAQALYHAYGGTDEALKLTKRYQSKSEGTSDGWIDLVDAEYAANTRASPDLIEAAQKQLTALHERDPTFFRTYVLAARLNIQSKQLDEAEAELQSVSAMKPQHDIANELSGWVKKLKAEKAAKEKEKSPQ